MEKSFKENEHYLYPGALFCHPQSFRVTTILGSCVSVCLWDPTQNVGGINHYLLPLWNGEGLSSPRYGNVAIPKLIDLMLSIGCRKESLKAKVFGGAAMQKNTSGLLNIGERNANFAFEYLAQERIPIIGSDVGGTQGRKLIFITDAGTVMLKKLQSKAD